MEPTHQPQQAGMITNIKGLVQVTQLKCLVSVILLFSLSCFGIRAGAQELNAQVIVTAQQLGTNVEASLVTDLQKQLTDFINDRKWSSDRFGVEEKINCNFSLALTGMPSQDVFEARLIIQAARPVYNSVYQSILVNYQDPQLVFKFRPFQKLDFNPSRASGTDPLTANLTATIAFYVNIILGMDYDSFKLGQGKGFYKNAQNIVLSAPKASNIKGWAAFDGQRNRYHLADDLNAAKLNDIHQVFYTYFRGGMDSLYDQQSKARNNVLEALTGLQELNATNPGTMIEQFFMESRTSELIGIFKEASPDIKAKARALLVELNPNGASEFNEQLK
ncbi:MAG TPA: DUF4835 family protein [Arachidicoccus sp.]|nr:DUF4835 family protein [Arachidicoccus sp.]